MTTRSSGLWYYISSDLTDQKASLGPLQIPSCGHMQIVRSTISLFQASAQPDHLPEGAPHSYAERGPELKALLMNPRNIRRWRCRIFLESIGSQIVMSLYKSCFFNHKVLDCAGFKLTCYCPKFLPPVVIETQ